MINGVIVDLEGTLIDGNEPLPGAIDFINTLSSKKMPFNIITNRVSKTPLEMAKIMNGIGFKVATNQIINPFIVLNEYLLEHNIRSYYFVGPEYLEEQIETDSISYDNPEYVIFCDFEYINCDYNKFNKIYNYIKNGSKIITTSYSNYYYRNNEYKLDTGSFTKMFEMICEKEAIIMGKPSKEIYNCALKQLNIKREEAIIIGDDILTDIGGGNNIGIKTVLVKTGKYKNGDENKIKPFKIVNKINETMEDMW
jgi:HAD superfamily hydrolase (TIGR01458 family)